MSYRIDLYREAEKTLDSLDRTTARRIEAKIEELTRDLFSPPPVPTNGNRQGSALLSRRRLAHYLPGY